MLFFLCTAWGSSNYPSNFSPSQLYSIAFAQMQMLQYVKGDPKDSRISNRLINIGQAVFSNGILYRSWSVIYHDPWSTLRFPLTLGFLLHFQVFLFKRLLQFTLYTDFEYWCRIKLGTKEEWSWRKNGKNKNRGRYRIMYDVLPSGGLMDKTEKHTERAVYNWTNCEVVLEDERARKQSQLFSFPIISGFKWKHPICSIRDH